MPYLYIFMLSIKTTYIRFSGMRLFFTAMFCCFCFTYALAQQQEICGNVVGIDGQNTFSNLLIINKRTSVGVFGNTDGSFCVKALKTDTLIISSYGYNRFYLSVRDSVEKEKYQVHVLLQKLSVELKEFEVIPKRELDEIQKDIEKLGFDKRDYTMSGFEALNSPITYLYQTFSRRERGRLKAIELENDDKRRTLLKELLQKYVDADVVFMLDEEFDDFIDFCAIPDEILKYHTQYEFILLIKLKYKQYRSSGVINRVPKR